MMMAHSATVTPWLLQYIEMSPWSHRIDKSYAAAAPLIAVGDNGGW